MPDIYLTRLAALAMLALGATVNAAVLDAEIQSFDTAAEASAQGWTPLVYGFNSPLDTLGFSNSNNTLGTSGAGEGGGSMTRGGVSYYADLSLGKPGAQLALTERLEAAGEFVVSTLGSSFPTAGFPTGVGYFTQANTGNSFGVLAFTINEEGPLATTKYRVLARSFLSAGAFAWGGGSESASGTAAGATWLTLDLATPYYFTSVWDPTIGFGQHRIELFDNTNPNAPVSVGVILANMSSTVRNSAEFSSTLVDAFGIRKMFAPLAIDPNNSATMFLDNAAYTTIPEPTAGLCLGVIGCAAVLRRRR